MLLLVVGGTLTARLTINTNNKLNFGQGIYKIKACDGWININLQKTDTAGGVLYGGSMVEAVNAIDISGLDTNACKNTNFKIKVFQTGNSTPLSLYTENASNDSSSQVWLKINGSGTMTILNTSGVDLGQYGDDYVALSQDPSTKVFTAYFFTPLAAANLVNSFTIESGPNA